MGRERGRADNPHIAPEAKPRQAYDWDLETELTSIEIGVSFQSCSIIERDVFKGNEFPIGSGM